MNDRSLESLLKNASGGAKTDQNAIREALRTGDTSRLTSALSQEDLQKVRAVLNDRQKMQQILNSPLGKKLLSQFQK